MALERAFEELRLFREAWSTPGMPSVIAAVHVRSASTALDELIGSVDVDDVLDAVFRTFCIGK
jgi:tRNA U34 5-carboxymethylaminomethyl modifying GTPase MnmE/TrmE